MAEYKGKGTFRDRIDEETEADRRQKKERFASLKSMRHIITYKNEAYFVVAKEGKPIEDSERFNDLFLVSNHEGEFVLVGQKIYNYDKRKHFLYVVDQDTGKALSGGYNKIYWELTDEQSRWYRLIGEMKGKKWVIDPKNGSYTDYIEPSKLNLTDWRDFYVKG